jgi:hypothetical protein
MHVFWHSKVLELKEVEEEIEKIRKRKLLSLDDEKDAELLKNEELVKDYKKKLEMKNISEKERIRILAEKVKILAEASRGEKNPEKVAEKMKILAVNKDAAQIDDLCESIEKVKDKVGEDFYFGLVWYSEKLSTQ